MGVTGVVAIVAGILGILTIVLGYKLKLSIDNNGKLILELEKIAKAMGSAKSSIELLSNGINKWSGNYHTLRDKILTKGTTIASLRKFLKKNEK